MPEFVIVQNAEKAEKGLPSWTFTVDGQPSLYWCPTRHAAERVIGRLVRGRSREAFGGPEISMGADRVVRASSQVPGRGEVFREEGPPEFETVMLSSGKSKSREKKKGWKFRCDGHCPEQSFATEQEAKAACALHAFMSRGKLNRLAAAQAELEAANPGKKCSVRVCSKRHRIVAEVDGAEFAVGFEPDGSFRFKAVEQTPAE